MLCGFVLRRGYKILWSYADHANRGLLLLVDDMEEEAPSDFFSSDDRIESDSDFELDPEFELFLS